MKYLSSDWVVVWLVKLKRKKGVLIPIQCLVQTDVQS